MAVIWIDLDRDIEFSKENFFIFIIIMDIDILKKIDIFLFFGIFLSII